MPVPNTEVMGKVDVVIIFGSKSSIELGLEVVTVGKPGELVALLGKTGLACWVVWAGEALSTNF